MKLTATTTSTSLFDLIETANSDAIALIEKKRIWNELNWQFGVEIRKDSDDIYVETILDEATTDSRPVDDTTPIFAFNCADIHNVYIYWSGDFYISIV